jgi:hypothetical protein
MACHMFGECERKSGREIGGLENETWENQGILMIWVYD